MGLFSEIGSFVKDITENIPIVGPIIGWAQDAIGTGLADATGTGSTNSARRYNNEVMATQFDYAKQLAEQQQAFNKENLGLQTQAQKDLFNYAFNKNSEYNSPSAQIQRLQEAGINPNVMFNGSNPNVAQSDSAGSAGLPSSGIPLSPSGMNIPIQSMSANARDAARLALETRRTDKDLEVLSKTLEGMEIDNLTKAKWLEIIKETGLDKANAEVQLLIQKALESDATSKKLLAEKDLIGFKQETEKVIKSLNEALKELNEKQKERLQIEIDNLDAYYKSVIRSNEGSAAASYASVALTREQTEQLTLMRDDILHIKKLERAKEQLDFNLLYNTFDDQLKVLKNQALISDVNFDEAKQQLDMLKKKNATTHEWMIYTDWILGNLERINDGANKWAPWALSRTDSERTVTTDFNEYGEATGSHSRIFTHDSSYKTRWSK